MTASEVLVSILHTLVRSNNQFQSSCRAEIFDPIRTILANVVPCNDDAFVNCKMGTRDDSILESSYLCHRAACSTKCQELSRRQLGRSTRCPTTSVSSQLRLYRGELAAQYDECRLPYAAMHRRCITDCLLPTEYTSVSSRTTEAPGPPWRHKI